jgi:adenylate kinase family enzyme
VSVVGNAGSGKSTLGRRLAERLGVPYIELDAMYHLPDWQQIDQDEFVHRIEVATAGDGWVVDGNYRAGVVDGPVWRRAETVVWLDLPRATVMRQLARRTVRRLVTRQVLWNGNREPWANLTRWDPRRNILRWAWTQHAKYVERYGSAANDPAYRHLTFVRLRSRAEAEAYLATVDPVQLP